MNKFEGVTVVHLEGSDYTEGSLNRSVDEEVIKADIVIDGGMVVKNRVSQVESLEAKTEFPAFKGLTLEPETAFRQIAALIEAGLIISVTDMNDKSDLSDCVFILARQYAEAAHDYAVENRKRKLQSK
ncbi:hypothetical protein ACQLT9_005642 [Salmonella enterica subsp. diarizonae]